MNLVIFTSDYLRWHYNNAFLDIVRVWGNMLWFILHTFSFLPLLKTLFSPWRRIHENAPPKGTFNLEYYAGSLLVNFLMRIVGFLVRGTILAFAFAVFAVIFFLGVLFLFFWVVAPLAVPIFLFSGFSLIG